MEPGPAIFFTQAQLNISPEPPLAAGSDRVEFPSADVEDKDIGTQLDTLEAVRTELFNEALGWESILEDPANLLAYDLVAVDETVPQAITNEIDHTQQAIDGAESSFLPDAYQENPPWYTPPVEEIPVERPRRPAPGEQ